MTRQSDIDFLLGITRPAPKKKVNPKFGRKRPKNLRPRRYYMPPEVKDTDLIKLENLHGGFCSCGRRMSGEAACLNCLNGLDYDQSFV